MIHLNEIPQPPHKIHELQIQSDHSSEITYQASMLMALTKAIQAALSSDVSKEWTTVEIASVNYLDDEDYGLCEVSICLQNGSFWWINPPLVFFVGEKVQFKSFSTDSEEYKKGWRQAIKVGESILMKREHDHRAYMS